MPTPAIQQSKIRADFNGVFGKLLCLSHTDTIKDENAFEVILEEGMIITVFEEDCDDLGNDDNLIATGIVIRSPESLSCRGSVWSLRIDDNGIRHESDITSPD